MYNTVVIINIITLEGHFSLIRLLDQNKTKHTMEPIVDSNNRQQNCPLSVSKTSAIKTKEKFSAISVILRHNDIENTKTNKVHNLHKVLISKASIR